MSDFQLKMSMGQLLTEGPPIRGQRPLFGFDPTEDGQVLPQNFIRGERIFRSHAMIGATLAFSIPLYVGVITIETAIQSAGAFGRPAPVGMVGPADERVAILTVCLLALVGLAHESGSRGDRPLVNESVLEGATTGFVLVAGDGQVLDATERAASLLGTDRDVLVGCSHQNLPTGLREAVERPGVDHAVESDRGRPFRIQAEMVDTDRTDAVWLCTVRDARRGSTTEMGTTETAHDDAGTVHEGSTDERPRDDSSATLSQADEPTAPDTEISAVEYDRAVARGCSEAVAIVDDTATIRAVTEALVNQTGYPESMLVGSTLSRLLSPADVQEVRSLLGDRLQTAGSRELDVTVQTSAGESRSTKLSCVPVSMDSFDATVCVFRDVSEHRQCQSDLEGYETIVEALADPVWTIAADGTISFVNEAFEAVSGRSRDDVAAGRLDLVDVVVGGDAELVRQTVSELLTGDCATDRATVEVALVTSDGRQVPVEMNVTALPTPNDGEPAFRGVASVARDVSHRKRRQEVLTVTNRVLRHNLRTHANLISGYADLLAAVAEGDTAEFYVEGIHESTEWLSTLGESLRALQETIEQQVCPTDPLSVSMIEDVALAYEDQYPEATVEVTLATDRLVDASPDAVSHAVSHVVENAIVHNDREDPSVWVEVTDDEDRIVISIADDGPGIPETERAVVMGETEVTQLEHGSGIGMWAARWFIQTVGGDVTIDARDPRGTVVRLSLPAAE